jgi:hypothetical protein
VRVISKSGGLPGYTSIITMIPEYGLGITVLIAGDSNMFAKIQDTEAQQSFVPLGRLQSDKFIRTRIAAVPL